MADVRVYMGRKLYGTVMAGLRGRGKRGLLDLHGYYRWCLVVSKVHDSTEH